VYNVHDVAAGGVVGGTTPGCVKAKMMWCEVLLHSPQPDGSWSATWMFPFLVGMSVKSCRDCNKITIQENQNNILKTTKVFRTKFSETKAWLGTIQKSNGWTQGLHGAALSKYSFVSSCNAKRQHHHTNSLFSPNYTNTERFM